jgi:uncharacterized phage protein (TIGR01671 family)
MREFKFRVWVLNKMTPWEKIAIEFTFDTTKGDDHFYLKEYFDYIISQEFIIMQFTGLVDKSGQEIYEGDILAVWLGTGKSRKQYTHEVKWITDLAEFRMPAPIKEFEVIGNLYENPELLKK